MAGAGVTVVKALAFGVAGGRVVRLAESEGTRGQVQSPLLPGSAGGTVRGVLRLEGLAVVALALAAYAQFGAGWGFFAWLVLLPDLSFLAYLAGPRVGAISYNAAHSYVGALALLAWACWARCRCCWPWGWSGVYTSVLTARWVMGSSTPADLAPHIWAAWGVPIPGERRSYDVPMPRILLIDDDEHLAAPLATYLARFGLVLDSAVRPGQGLALLRATSYDAAILDVMLPEMDGFALCREIRKSSDIPIVMLTARGDVMDRVVGLELGADDYLPKPFEPRELVARLQTILRRQRARPAATPGAQRVFQGLAIDLQTREVLCQGQRVELTGTEFELLALLAAEPGKVFSRDDILNHLRGHEADLYTRAVDIVVSRLRKKLEPLDCIKTLRNAGYTLAVGQAEAR